MRPPSSIQIRPLTPTPEAVFGGSFRHSWRMHNGLWTRGLERRRVSQDFVKICRTCTCKIRGSQYFPFTELPHFDLAAQYLSRILPIHRRVRTTNEFVSHFS